MSRGVRTRVSIYRSRPDANAIPPRRRGCPAARGRLPRPRRQCQEIIRRRSRQAHEPGRHRARRAAAARPVRHAGRAPHGLEPLRG